MPQKYTAFVSVSTDICQRKYPFPLFFYTDLDRIVPCFSKFPTLHCLFLKIFDNQLFSRVVSIFDTANIATLKLDGILQRLASEKGVKLARKECCTETFNYNGYGRYWRKGDWAPKVPVEARYLCWRPDGRNKNDIARQHSPKNYPNNRRRAQWIAQRNHW